MTKRLFLGIPIGEKDKSLLFKSIEPLQELYPDWRFVKKENYHVTISFFGETEAKDIHILITLIQSIADETSAFLLHLNELTLTPARSPRMLWAKGSHAREFGSLVTSTELTVSEKLDLPNFRRDHTPLPHVTLARFDPRRIKAHTSALPDLSLIIPVTSCILFESVLSSHGASYSALKEFSLKQD